MAIQIFANEGYLFLYYIKDIVFLSSGERIYIK